MTRARSTHELTYSIQDYLKSIYDLNAAGGTATTNAIAARLGISAASVTGMLQKLAALSPALVTYRKHQGARLTESGRRAALQVIRHHRLLETWLVQSLGYSWDEVHSEAEKLEHAVSEDLEKRIADALGNPARDPHGEPIPSADLIMPTDPSVPLSELQTGEEATVHRVQASDGVALRHLHDIGLSIGSRVTVLVQSSYDQVMTLRIRGHENPITLGPMLTERVFVERADNQKKRSK